MNYRNTIIKLLGAVLLIGAVAASCYDYDEVPLVKLAVLENEITMDAAGGAFEVMFYTNGAYHIEYLGEADWLTLTTSAAVDDKATLTGVCAPNEGFKRRVDLVFCSDLDTRRDTIVVRQKALADAFIEFDAASIILPGAGGSTVSTIRTNIPFDDMSVEIVYSDVNNKDWISDFYINDSDSDDRDMHILTYPNEDEVSPRAASIVLSFIDGWGDRVAVRINVLQCNAKEEAAKDISFEDFRSQYAGGGIIYDYIQINGIVVSNREQGNVGCPVQLTNNTVDDSPVNTTIYFESEDGQYGIAVIADSEDDNIFEQFDRVTLMLHSATLTRRGSGETCPVRYELSGFNSSMVFSRSSGTDAPEKHRTIGTLSDDDMFTYVTLDNVQIPVRMGGLFPYWGSYYNNTTTGYCTKQPLLVIDKEGNDLFMLTNHKCLYHRDGTRLPYGSGRIRGVITHEHFSRFAWASGLKDVLDGSGNYFYNDSNIEDYNESVGNIGRYQLRHQIKGDIWDGMEDDFETGDFKLLTEFRWRSKMRATGTNAVTERNLPTDMGDSLDVATYGKNGWFTHTWQTKYTGTSSKNYNNSSTHLTHNATYWYLGPVGTNSDSMYGNQRGNRYGLGMIIDETKEDASSRPGRFAYNKGIDGYYGQEESRLEFACQYAKAENAGYGDSGWTTAYETTTSSTYDSVPNWDGTGKVKASLMLMFASNYWWDYDYNENSSTDNHNLGNAHGFLVGVSTRDISAANVVCMQIAIRPVSEMGYTPRYWTVEWTDVDPVPSASVTWHHIGDFTLPDSTASGSVASNPRTIWSIQGYESLNFKLDSEILGKDNVYIIIRPTSDVCGSRNGDYESSILSEYTSENAVGISYLAIRYN